MAAKTKAGVNICTGMKQVQNCFVLPIYLYRGFFGVRIFHRKCNISLEIHFYIFLVLFVNTVILNRYDIKWE